MTETRPPEDAAKPMRWPENLGVILISIDRPHYGELAYNMALSLRLAEPGLPITVLADETALATLSEGQRGVFDRVVEPAPEYLVEADGAKNPFRLKTHLDQVTPYEKTLYLDADGLFFTHYHDLRQLFERLEPLDFHIQEEFRYTRERAHAPNQYFWGSLEAIWSALGLDARALYADYNSSFFWFRKNEATRRFFERAREHYAHPPVELRKIGAFGCDEVPFSMASAELAFHSPIPEYRPLYLQNFSEEHPWTPEGGTFRELRSSEEFKDIIRAHPFLSLPAIPPTRSVVKLYNHIARANAREAGDEDFFAFRVEKKLIKEWLVRHPEDQMVGARAQGAGKSPVVAK